MVIIYSYNGNYKQRAKHLKNILKREYNKGKPVSQVIFHIFYILLILILWLFFIITFPEKNKSKIKRNIENVLVLYCKLHNLYQSRHFFIKIEGLNWRIYWSSNSKCLGKTVLLEVAVAIFKNILKITVKLPCESVVKIPKKYLWRSSVLVNMQGSGV